MARLSATSSAVDTNGHIKEPTTVPLPAEGDVPLSKPFSHDDTEISTSNNDDDEETPLPSSDSYPVSHDPTLLPGGSRDLCFIGLQAFVLGSLFALSICATITLVFVQPSRWWRLPAFAICFSVFHFMEFWTTAAYNTPSCRASSFLLFNNGKAYAIANLLAALEITISAFFPEYQAIGVYPTTIAVGLTLVIIGQFVRSMAMVQASTNFNHIVQSERKDTHVLVTKGFYSVFRHPSYFGFFWWSIGTQLLVGNKVCLVGFAVVLWKFFNRRIAIEEKHLVMFFGDDYENYRKRTGTLMPFIG
ncbi:hypothetical protein M409DRAFT_67795 [Zasmidium cellare ATCC 36951]|uniref:Protein-S-isoprenylcysteine O-methyltransferase n=1 Tax=Zasmidium cellare ATCC 36951 TaxID=1080233 RepID=A0A6A6CBW8_ZASCE|nr:uncharacterized protein M409DRAFT_67795 [Zasmidium cellare ATCC 36951]KAF2164687.1 hypothetical protein M409DRAFT_67795 [Zasmidium cellare ATCC 36951]